MITRIYEAADLQNQGENLNLRVYARVTAEFILSRALWH